MSFLRRPSATNTQNNNQKKNIIRFGSPDPPPNNVVPQRKGSFVSMLGTLVGVSGSTQQQLYFDNGVDPLGRLSVDSSPPPPPPSPVQERPQPRQEVNLHWIEKLCPLEKPLEVYPPPPPELLSRVRYFIGQVDPAATNKVMHMAVYGNQEGEAALNAKLFHKFGEGLPVRLPGQKPGARKDGQVPKTLREMLRAFLTEHDPGFLAIEGEAGLDDYLTRAQEYGIDAIELELARKYGVGLSGKKADAIFMSDSSAGSTGWTRDQSSYEQMAQAAAPHQSSSPSPLSPIQQRTKTAAGAPPGLERSKSDTNKPQTFYEVSVVEDQSASQSSTPSVVPLGSGTTGKNATKPKPFNFFDDKSLRADLKAFYTKHDVKKLEPQKFEPIIQWAYKIGPSELNHRFEEKYGESLSQFVEDRLAGRPGVAPGPKIQPKTDVTNQPSVANACQDYREAVPGKSFGACVCGFSRVDHQIITSLLIPGKEEPQFHRVKPKTKKVVAAPATSTLVSKTGTASSSPSSKPVSPKTQPSIPAKSQPISPKPQASVSPSTGTKFPSTAKPGEAMRRPTIEIKAEGRDGPCSDYRLDLEGRSFGVCKCGWTRPEHYKAKPQTVAWAQ